MDVSKFRDLVPLLTSRGLRSGENGILYFARCVMLIGRETWPVKVENVVRLARNDARMVRWMCKVRPEDRIYAEELRARLKLKGVRECLQNRRLQWFDNLEKMEKSAWSCKCRTFKVSSSFPREQPWKTWKI